MNPDAPKIRPIIAKGLARFEPFSKLDPQKPIALTLATRGKIVPGARNEKTNELKPNRVPMKEGTNSDRFLA